MTTFARSDIVAPRSVQDTALAIGQRAASATIFTPTPTGPFDHGTTMVATRISSDVASALTTSSTVADLLTASSGLQTQINSLWHAINRVVYDLEANGLTS